MVNLVSGAMCLYYKILQNITTNAKNIRRLFTAKSKSFCSTQKYFVVNSIFCSKYKRLRIRVKSMISMNFHYFQGFAKMPGLLQYGTTKCSKKSKIGSLQLFCLNEKNITGCLNRYSAWNAKSLFVVNSLYDFVVIPGPHLLQYTGLLQIRFTTI